MNDFLRLDEVELWHVAGWTMLHFAWLGAAVMVAALVGRLVVLRRAPAAARYVAAVATLAVLAALPIAIAARLVATLPNDLAAVPPPIVAPAVGPTAHGSAVGSAPANGVAVDLVATSAPAAVPMGDEPASAAAVPRQSRGLTGGDAGASSFEAVTAAVEACVPYLPWVWLVGTPLTFALLATGLVGTRRLRSASRTIDDGPIAEACARLCRTLGVRARVAVAVCERIAAPVLVGIVRPVILLPPAALTGWSPDEVEMVLLHELAHVRRWDNFVNLLQRIVESLLFFHPAVWWASAWVRRERETCCDAIVVAHTNEPHAYAEMLIEFASRLGDPSEPGRPRPRLSTTLTSAMAAGPLRWRVRRILGLDDDPMLVSGKSLAMAAGSLVVIAAIALVYLPSRGQAEESAANVKDSTTEVTEGTEANHDEGTSHRTQVKTQDGLESRQRETGDKLPTLDEQAGLEFCQDSLGLSLEPLSQRELQRVKALGFEHGVKVLGYRPHRQSVGTEDPLLPGDVLVDLVPWPAEHPQLMPDVVIKNGQGELTGKWFMTMRFTVVRHALPAQELDPAAAWPPNVKVVHGLIIAGPLGPQPHEMAAIADTAKEAAAETPSDAGSAKFPSLEQQKLADLAYRQLGLELQIKPLSPEDLQRVKALGYDGGLKVTGLNGPSPVLSGDILVGLGVWPTTSLEDVAKILRRSDLAELDPLKFYVVRSDRSQQGRFSGGPQEDVLVTGRIHVSLGSSQQDAGVGNGASKPQAESDAGRSADKSPLLYDGKTFDQWRDAWQTELSPERRAEAVKALATFGANGYGREAAKAILDVAGQYDWTYLSSRSPVGKLKKQAIEALTGANDATHVPAADSLPVLLGVVRSDNQRVRMFLARVLGGFHDPKATDALLELSRDADRHVQFLALSALPQVDANHPNMKVVDRIREGLREDAADADWLMRKLITPGTGDGMGGPRQSSMQLYYVPELYLKLFSQHEFVQRSARSLIHYIRPADAPPVVEQLVKTLSSDASVEKQVEAIRALAAIGPSAREALPAIDRLITGPVDVKDPRVVPAAVARGMILGDPAGGIAIGILATIKYPGGTTDAVNDERNEVLQPPSLGGGGTF